MKTVDEIVAAIAKKDSRYSVFLGDDGKLLKTPPAQTTATRPEIYPCPNRSEQPVDKVLCPTCSGRVELKVYACSVFKTCTIGTLAEGHALCAGCTANPVTHIQKPTLLETSTQREMKWVSTVDLVANAIKLASLLPLDITAIAGIPRSGMIPASIIATHLHLPLYELSHAGLRLMGSGSRGGFAEGYGRMAIIDDTIFSGVAIKAAKALIGRPSITAVVYARPAVSSIVDIFVEELPSPHLLEWNILNCGVAVGNSIDPIFYKGVAVDLDGIIIHDEQSSPLSVGAPYLVPKRSPIPLIVSGRREATRQQTEVHLQAVGARWQRLELLPDTVPLSPENIAAHKAEYYKKSDLGFFMESCPKQAQIIFELSGKPVICPIIQKVFYDNKNI